MLHHINVEDKITWVKDYDCSYYNDGLNYTTWNLNENYHFLDDTCYSGSLSVTDSIFKSAACSSNGVNEDVMC